VTHVWPDTGRPQNLAVDMSVEQAAILSFLASLTKSKT
jgi:hypothetical protein